MPEIKDILALMRSFAPEAETEPDFEDNVGLLIGSEKGQTDKVIACLDCTASVVEEAAEKGAGLIISHHPVIFRSVRRVTDEDPTGRVILSAVRKGITVYSAHTNLDFCKGGINDYCAELMGLKNVSPLTTENGVGIGRVGEREEIRLSALVRELARTFDDDHVRTTGDDVLIKRIAVVNGGGGDIPLTELARRSGADCYVTADVPHHVMLHARACGFPLVMMQHYTMERIYIKRLVGILSSEAEKRGLSVVFEASESESCPISGRNHD